MVHAFAPDDNLAAAGVDRVAQNDFARRVAHDFPRQGILDRKNVAANRRVDRGILEREIAPLGLAVDQRQVPAVAERLRADDLAADQGQVLG